MSSNIDTTNGGGPWGIDVPALDAGDVAEFHLKSMEYRGRKGYFRPWLPLDSVTLKNRDTDNAVEMLLNGQYNVLVDPNEADTYSEAGITTIRLENLGSTTIPAGTLVMQVAADAFDADDAARTSATRPPLEKLARGVLGL